MIVFELMKEPNQSIDEFDYFLKAYHGIKNQSKVTNRTNKQTNKPTKQNGNNQNKFLQLNGIE